MASLQELEAELAKREQESFSASKAAQAFAAGAARGGYGVTTLPVLPVDIARQVAGKTSGIEEGAKALGIKTEADFPGYERFFRAGEGAAPGAGFGATTGAALGPVGMLGGALVGGLGGLVSNVAAKELFPSSPAAQMAVGLLAPSGVAAARARAGGAPKGIEGPVTQPETGITETAGQRTGAPLALLQEEKIRRSAQAGPVASAFDVAQAQSVDGFLGNIQKFSANPNLNAEQITQGIYKAYDNFATQLQNKFKATNTANFNKAKEEAGSSSIIPTNNVQQTIDRLIAQYDNPEVPGMQAIVGSLRRIKGELTTTTTTGGRLVDERGVPFAEPTTTVSPNNISIDRLQQNLSAWGDAAYKGTYSVPGKKVSEFSDASPGVVKGIARQVLGAFRDDLNEAAESGVRGAGTLKQARDAFRENLQVLDDYASKPLVKYFDQPSANALVPEDVVSKFVNLPATQKADAAAVLRNARPDIWESLRSQGLGQILEPARIGEAAAAGSPKFDIGTALKQLGGLKDADIQWLFPTKEEKNLFRTGLEQIQRIQRRSSFMDLDPAQFNQAARTAAEGAGALKGAIAKYGVQTVVDSWRLMVGFADEQKMAYMMFNPNGRQLIRELSKPNPKLDKVPTEAINALVAGSLAPAVTARPASPQTAEPRQEQPVFSVEDLEAELRRREQAGQ
jgi:hypothetical protein